MEFENGIRKSTKRTRASLRDLFRTRVRKNCNRLCVRLEIIQQVFVALFARFDAR